MGWRFYFHTTTLHFLGCKYPREGLQRIAHSAM